MPTEKNLEKLSLLNYCNFVLQHKHSIAVRMEI